MNELQKWKENNEKEIVSLLDAKQYTKLLNEYCKISGLSQVKLAKQFCCSRKALMRYQTGIRNVPMGIVSTMIQRINLEYSRKNRKENVDNNTEDDDKAIIWPWKDGILFNILFLYRKAYNLSLFEAACKLDIQEETLRLYEHGEKRISLPDIEKILRGYGIKIDGLLPELASYDGGKTYLPLKKPFHFVINGMRFNIEGTNFYRRVDDEWYYDWHKWPMTRYDAAGKPLLNYMPDELTVDEYINTDELAYIKDDFENYYEKDLSGLKLPPNYRHLLEKSGKKEGVKYSGYRYTIDDIEFTDDYKIKVYVLPQGRTVAFDLTEYVFSDSPWYCTLRDKEYFFKGNLQYIGEQMPENQCIVWPDGQYIRFIELYMDKYKYRYFAYKFGTAGNNGYDVWTSYYWDN